MRLLEQARAGDTVCVYAIDRLGRDALDVQTTVRRLVKAGITLDVHGIGQIGGGVGEIVLAVLAQVADLERERIRERTEGGRKAARASLEATGKTHRGKESLGRPRGQDAATVDAWRTENNASAADAATHFKISVATVKRYRKELGAAANAPAQAAGAEVIDALTLPDPEPVIGSSEAESSLGDRIGKLVADRKAREADAALRDTDGPDPLTLI
jgi:putative DNA-invertase from lambdoid prophage Rac